MDNEVIIDGCNVTECWFYVDVDDLNCSCSMESSNRCRNNHNCYFKQLQRVKAENEKLKKEVEISNREEVRWKSNFNNYKDVFKKQHDILFKYKQALEDIKEIANEPCIDDEDCETCDSNCMSREIINKINEVLKHE